MKTNFFKFIGDQMINQLLNFWYLKYRDLSASLSVCRPLTKHDILLNLGQ